MTKEQAIAQAAKRPIHTVAIYNPQNPSLDWRNRYETRHTCDIPSDDKRVVFDPEKDNLKPYKLHVGYGEGTGRNRWAYFHTLDEAIACERELRNADGTFRSIERVK